MNKSCIRCGAPLKENAIKYCSKRCYGDAKITKVERTCEVCRKPFFARHNAVEQGNGRFCTRACVNRSRAVPLDERLDAMLAQSTTNEDGCLIWGGPCDRAGYGVISDDVENKWKQLRASHLVYERFVAPIPDGQYVLHRCDNPPCVEPSHLWLGSKAENNLDMVAKERRKAPVLTPELSAAIQADRQSGMKIRELVQKYAVYPGTIYRALGRHYR